MKARLVTAILLAAAATPALASGLDSRRSPYPPSAYSGYVGLGAVGSPPETRFRAAPAYRYSGQHAGGPADALPRH